MCIICIKPKGVEAPTKREIDNMCAANPDGFGMAASDGNKVVVFKTMDVNSFKKQCKNVKKEWAVIYHMRIATHGSKRVENCHPWLTNDEEWAFAHNGILSIDNEGDMTDSETFLRRIAEPMLSAGITPDTDAFTRMIDCVIGGSKFAFLNKKGDIFKFGNYLEHNGLLMSNSSYDYTPWSSWGGLGCGCSVKHSTGKSKKRKKKQSKCDDETLQMIKESLLDEFAYGGYTPDELEYSDWYQYYVTPDMGVSEEDFESVFCEAIDEALQMEFDLYNNN